MRLRRLEAFREGLRDLGYVEGQNIVVDARWAGGQYAQYPALIGDLVRLKEHPVDAEAFRGTSPPALESSPSGPPAVEHLGRWR